MAFTENEGVSGIDILGLKASDLEKKLVQAARSGFIQDIKANEVTLPCQQLDAATAFSAALNNIVDYTGATKQLGWDIISGGAGSKIKLLGLVFDAKDIADAYVSDGGKAAVIEALTKVVSKGLEKSPAPPPSEKLPKLAKEKAEKVYEKIKGYDTRGGVGGSSSGTGRHSGLHFDGFCTVFWKFNSYLNKGTYTVSCDYKSTKSGKTCCSMNVTAKGTWKMSVIPGMGKKSLYPHVNDKLKWSGVIDNTP